MKRNRIYTVRLSEAELSNLKELASQLDKRPSTLVREQIISMELNSKTAK